MLLPGTQMHIVTFIFVSIEIVIFFYLIIYRIARIDDKINSPNIILIFLLLIYNITGGLLPDPNLPGSIFLQESLAYATGFITPCYFPYYVYKAFSLDKMKFHALRGVFFFLVLPYLIFLFIYAFTNKLEVAKDVLILPVLYSLWVITTMVKAIRYKYNYDFSSKEFKEELIILLISLTPWVMLPVIDFFNIGQGTEACITNFGFLSLFTFQIKRHVKSLRTEQMRLMKSEQQLLNWNSSLQSEVSKRTVELELINEQRTNTFVNLAHEIKTPLTLINNYLEEYINNNRSSEELTIIKRNIDKLSIDMVNLFDLEKFNKGFAIYNHQQVCNISELVKDAIQLFTKYDVQNGTEIKSFIENDIFIQADPVAVNRIIYNLIENSIKFSNDLSCIEVYLTKCEETLQLSVKDYGSGIPVNMHLKVFEPYYQITNLKNNVQGMGLGLPIVKKVINDLDGIIQIISNPKITPGTEILIILKRCKIIPAEPFISTVISKSIINVKEKLEIDEIVFREDWQTILVVEDRLNMLNFLHKKLSLKYNIYVAINGCEAIKKLKQIKYLPDLIITDVMMDKLNGYDFANIILKTSQYAHIPIIFLSAKTSFTERLIGLKLGAIDYVAKPFSITELLQKIDSILTNAHKQKKEIWNKAFDLIKSNNNLFIKNESAGTFDQNCELYHLTSREKDISKLICQGKKYKDIGEILFIAERTVTKHAQNIFLKTMVTNKVELTNLLELS